MWVYLTAADPCTIKVINPATGLLSYLYVPYANVIPSAAFNLFAVQVAQNLKLKIHFTLARPGFHGALFRVGDLHTPICFIHKHGEALCLTCPCVPFIHHDPLLAPLFMAGLVADSSDMFLENLNTPLSWTLHKKHNRSWVIGTLRIF
jgi:hypothetical protein